VVVAIRGCFGSSGYREGWKTSRRIRTGKPLPLRQVRPGSQRLASALRMAAQSFHRSKSALGDWFRRIRAKLGTNATVTVAAPKLKIVLLTLSTSISCLFLTERIFSIVLQGSRSDLTENGRRVGRWLTDLYRSLARPSVNDEKPSLENLY
jgi:hypothetical protein